MSLPPLVHVKKDTSETTPLPDSESEEDKEATSFLDEIDSSLEADALGVFGSSASSGRATLQAGELGDGAASAYLLRAHSHGGSQHSILRTMKSCSPTTWWR